MKSITWDAFPNVSQSNKSLQQTQTSRRSSPSTSLLSAFFPNQSLAREARVLSVCQSNKTSQITRNSRLQPPIRRLEINLLGCSLFLMFVDPQKPLFRTQSFQRSSPQPPSLLSCLLGSFFWNQSLGKLFLPNVCQSTKTKNLQRAQSSQLSSPATSLPPFLRVNHLR